MAGNWHAGNGRSARGEDKRNRSQTAVGVLILRLGRLHNSGVKLSNQPVAWSRYECGGSLVFVLDAGNGSVLPAGRTPFLRNEEGVGFDPEELPARQP